MSTFHRFFGSFLLISLLAVYTPITQAEMQQQGYGNMPYTAAAQVDDSQHRSYGGKIGNKALNGFANLTTGILEIPKNIINTMNQSNFFYGVFGGFTKGLINTLGRMGCGIADLITFPLPTKPIAHPIYIWDNFDIDTTYGDVFRLNRTPEEKPVIEEPVAQPVARPVKPVAAAPQSLADLDQNQQDINRKLDSLFKKRMRK